MNHICLYNKKSVLVLVLLVFSYEVEQLQFSLLLFCDIAFIFPITAQNPRYKGSQCRGSCVSDNKIEA